MPARRPSQGKRSRFLLGARRNPENGAKRTPPEQASLVPGTGLEPVSHAAVDFKSTAVTDFATRAGARIVPSSHRRAKFAKRDATPEGPARA